MDRTCRECEAALTGRQTHYCSKACGMIAAHRIERAGPRTEATVARIAAYNAANRRRWADRKYVVSKVCERCGCSYETRAGEPQRFCSNSCARQAEARRRRALAKQRRSLNLKSRGTMVQGGCRRCGRPFVARDPHTLYCGAGCKGRDHKDRRRALEWGAKITPGARWRVHERCGWKCQLCGWMVDRAASVPSRDAAVIDHVTPLARGGEHGPSNWQTAHFLCNSTKGARVEDAHAA